MLPTPGPIDWPTLATLRARLLEVPTFPREEDLRETLALVVRAMGWGTGFLVLAGHLADAPDDVLFG